MGRPKKRQTDSDSYIKEKKKKTNKKHEAENLDTVSCKSRKSSLVKKEITSYDVDNQGKRKRSKRGACSKVELNNNDQSSKASNSTVTKRKKTKCEIDNSEHKPSFSSDITGDVQDNIVKTDAGVLKTNPKCTDGFSSSDSEWEEVEENCEQNLEDYKPSIPEEGVEITIDCPSVNIHKRKKKEFDEMDYIRLYVNRARKDAQLCMHKVHLLCLLGHGFYVNDILNSTLFKNIALSLIPTDILNQSSGKKVDKINTDGIEKVVTWFCYNFNFESNKDPFNNLHKNLITSFETKTSSSSSEYNLMFIVIARVLGFKARLCLPLYPMSYKAQNLIKKAGKLKKEDGNTESSDPKASCSSKTQGAVNSTKKLECKNDSSKTKKKKKVQHKKKDEKADQITIKSEPISRTKRSNAKSYKISSDESDIEREEKDLDLYEEEDNQQSDEYDKPKRKGKKQNKTEVKSNSRKTNRKVLSSDSESPSSEPFYKPDSVLCWAEVFSKPEKQWISIECSTKSFNKPSEIEPLVPHPVAYIVSYDNESHIKDVTRRYCEEFLTSVRKLRADPEWWEETIEPFLPPNSKLDREEEKKLDQMLINKPLPTTVAAFKNHPLYALKRHLLKFEAIYPPDAPPVGFFRQEPIYARDCVCQLHSRETWVKEARVVRIGEEPYKIVKARPKWDKIAGVMRTDLPLEVFGLWQTEPYEPPIAVNGKVPRNEYGNVDLFKPCMLPRGTVHLQISCLNRIARKLGIDCSPAVVGFDGHKGSVHPVFDGFVVCEEFKDTLLAAWDEEQENARKREEEKREKRIYGNWKKLIKGLLIRERIRLKYDVK